MKMPSSILPVPLAVDSIKREIRRMKVLLQEHTRENETLRAQLALRPRPIYEIDLESLRRRIVFCCHPDRGGDTGLLRQVIELFDHLDPAA
jgi:hypothetical protein